MKKLEPMTGERLKEIRTRLGISQADLAVLAGMERQSGQRCISQWERGLNRIPGPTAFALSLMLSDCPEAAIPAVAALKKILERKERLDADEIEMAEAAIETASVVAAI